MVVKGLSSIPIDIVSLLLPRFHRFLLIMVNVNSMIPAADKAINAFSANFVEGDKELESNLVWAQAYLAYLHELHNDFHDKIERFGPKIPAEIF